MDDLFPGARASDPDTSHKAAASIAPAAPTIRTVVKRFFSKREREGDIDEALVLAYPDAPESSFRKRRSELAQEGWLIDSGRRRKNRHGNEEIVWVHRDFVDNPPPLKDPQATPQPQPSRQEVGAHERLAAHSVSLHAFAVALRKEGRTMFADALREIAEDISIVVAG